MGPWLPEPVDTRADPGLGTERGEALELAVLLLLEQLSPTERAAYVLREAFSYDYKEIAEVIQVEEPNARQLSPAHASDLQMGLEGRRRPRDRGQRPRIGDPVARGRRRPVLHHRGLGGRHRSAPISIEPSNTKTSACS